MSENLPGGSLTLADGLTLSRMGYGAMQLAGPGVFGPPRDREQALAVLREAVDLGVTPHRHQRLLRPVRGQRADPRGAAPVPRGSAHRHQGRRAPRRRPLLDPGAGAATNSRPRSTRTSSTSAWTSSTWSTCASACAEGTGDDPLAEQFGALAELRQQGLIRHLGLSNVTLDQLTEAQAIAPVVTVQNLYNLANRQDDALVDRCAAENIAFAAFFPLGGFTPLQSDTLDDVAARLGASPQQVALAWLLQRSPTTVLIPGTSSVAHLRENIAAADLDLPADAIEELDTIGG